MGSMERMRGFWRRTRLRGFWHRVTEGLTLRELWVQFRREAGASYRVYTQELDEELAEQPRWRRWLTTVKALAWAMLMKLSPARRVFLLVALVLILWGQGDRSAGRALAGAVMVLIVLVLELADWVTMKRDLQIAREIQQWLVPQTVPQIHGVDIAFTTRPANTVAGDYYDAFLRPSDGAPEAAQPLIVVIADVAGKSMPAALLMATFQASLRTLTYEPLPLRELVGQLNRYSCEHSMDGRRFTTAVLAELDVESGALTYVNAGHNAPVLRRASGELVRLEAGGLPLGIQADVRYESGTVMLSPGDLLVIFTDGVVDAQDDRGEDYGEPRLLELLRAMRDAGAAAALQRLMTSVESFAGPAPHEDDLTCLVLRYTGS
jgi:sigma-B regulation protein RsbU (phosphoserine phosphatase)